MLGIEESSLYYSSCKYEIRFFFAFNAQLVNSYTKLYNCAHTGANVFYFRSRGLHESESKSGPPKIFSIHPCMMLHYYIYCNKDAPSKTSPT